MFDKGKGKTMNDSREAIFWFETNHDEGLTYVDIRKAEKITVRKSRRSKNTWVIVAIFTGSHEIELFMYTSKAVVDAIAKQIAIDSGLVKPYYPYFEQFKHLESTNSDTKQAEVHNQQSDPIPFELSEQEVFDENLA